MTGPDGTAVPGEDDDTVLRPAAPTGGVPDDATVLRPGASGARPDPDATVLRPGPPARGADDAPGEAPGTSQDPAAEEDGTMLRPALSTSDLDDDGTILRPASVASDPVDEGTVLRSAPAPSDLDDDGTILRPAVSAPDSDDDGTVLRPARGGVAPAGGLPHRDAGAVAQVASTPEPQIPRSSRSAYVPSVVATSSGPDRYAPRSDHETSFAAHQDLGHAAARTVTTRSVTAADERHRRSRRAWRVTLLVCGVVVVGLLVGIGFVSGLL